MADVADFAVADAEGAEKRNDRHRGYDPFHLERDGDGEEISLAIREQDRAGDHDAENRARCADGWRERIIAAPKARKVIDDNVNQSRADASQKVIAKKTVASPDEFHFATKHPQHEHVEEDVPNISHCMQEKIGEGLP